MTKPAADVPTPSKHRLRVFVSGALVVIVMAAVIGFYGWTVRTSRAPLDWQGQKRDYYNLLVDGFQAGHLYMNAVPDPALVALPREKRPGNAPFLLDASLYQGHYYLYFGVVPVVLLYWPYAALTGQDMPEAGAALIFGSLAFIVSVGWWFDVRRRFFPELGIGWHLLAILTIGFGSAVASTLRRPLFYEVAILAGWTFGVATLWALTRAIVSPRRASVWLAPAGLAAGLAIGSRPNLAPGLAVLLAFGCGVVSCRLAAGWRDRGRRLLVALLIAGAASGVIGIGLAAYNYARFGSIFEFGHTYQIGVNPKRLFHAANLRHNLGLYYLAPPAVGAYFPFVTPAQESKKPVDYVGFEQTHGEWPWLPVVLAGIVMSAVAWRRGRKEEGWGWVLSLMLGWFGVNFLITGLTGVRANRYMVDFHPALVLAGLLLLGVHLAGAGWWRRSMRAVTGAMLVIVVLFNALASMQVHGWFAATDPLAFKALAAAADRIVWRAMPALFAGVGDREAEFHWPKPGQSGRFPLISAGTSGTDDGIWLDDDGGGRVRFVYQHWEYGTAEGAWFEKGPNPVARIRLSGGFLLPPVVHPWYGSKSAVERAALKDHLRITVDSVVRFDRDVPSFNPAPWQLHWGRWRLSNGEDLFYPAEIARPRRVAPDETRIQGLADRRGVVRLSIKLPKDRYGLMEPLVQSGTFPRCDVLMVRFTRPGAVELIHDNFGNGAFASAPIPADYDRWQTVEVEMPTANDGIGFNDNDVLVSNQFDRLVVRWNGVEVLRSPNAMHRAEPADIATGVNLVNASGCRMLFAGQLQRGPAIEPLASVANRVLEYALDPGRVLVGSHGLLIGWNAAGAGIDGSEGAASTLAVGVVWRRLSPEGPVSLGWFDDGRVTWADQPLSGVPGTLRIYLPLTGDGSGGGKPDLHRLVEVEEDGRPVVRAHTSFFAGGSVFSWALEGRRWKGTEHLDWNSVAQRTGRLPGGIKILFALPEDGTTGSEPILCAGPAGAADGIYLKPVGAGRFVFGLDHWGIGSVEGPPVVISGATVHALTIQMDSLQPAGGATGRRVRLTLDGHPVLDVEHPLYPVKPGQIVVGRNPIGMSTSGAVFSGAIYSILINQPVEP